ncbi:hypothetical protein [Burkholderia pseudomallei]|uniref:hypothetical protein n=1 Tax=Burkholderia pseudomallei TaxID=28450 RepID=UPI00051061F1|nr:hypothetical protein [Burkholderia pseudomallei]KGD43381.1 hypothetical protein DP44_5191 [Burkholderia pseudomallei]KGS19350.1 hypothetical protein X962_5931 [Burkholderia pseudomallei MSHR7343]KGS73361.1 hypothetical protein X947_5811 [Burkholderia pseudomallei MSHR7334]MBM5586006.1 hypothetical protein [Burkholderia pseudomallei]
MQPVDGQVGTLLASFGTLPMADSMHVRGRLAIQHLLMEAMTRQSVFHSGNAKGPKRAYRPYLYSVGSRSLYT